MTQCVRAARTDKTIVEIDVVTDDALDRAVRRAVEDGIEAVSSYSTLQAWSMGLSEARVNDRCALSGDYWSYDAPHHDAICRANRPRAPLSLVALLTGVS